MQPGYTRSCDTLSRLPMATHRLPRSRRQPQPNRAPQLLQPHRIEPPAADYAALERELLSFDADEDILSLVAMPRCIPAAARAAITTLLARRFASVAQEVDEQADALEAWLYTPHRLLGDACPFDRIIAGDALAVLIALVDPPADLLEALEARTRTASPPPQRPTLALIR